MGVFPGCNTTTLRFDRFWLELNGCGGQNPLGIPFWLVGEFTTHFGTYLSGDWDVHWGYDLDFDPWPNGLNWLGVVLCHPFGRGNPSFFGLEHLPGGVGLGRPPHKWVWLKINQEGQTAGFGPFFHLPGFHFGTGFLSHSQILEV